MTKTLRLKQSPEYTLKIFKGSKWVRVEKNNTMLSLCMDLHSAYQVVYQDIHDSGGHCEVICKDDWR
jgi:hypothetical protein